MSAEAAEAPPPGDLPSNVKLRRAFAEAIRPRGTLGVDEWAARERRIAPESGSPFPGHWKHDVTPYLVEPMQCLSFQHPARNVVFKKSHQVGGSEVGVNWFGYLADRDPCSMLIVLPTIDEAGRYNRIKLQPTIDVTPCLGTHTIKDQKARETGGSTGFYKRFVGGGFAQITGANSSAGLQMLSVRASIFEEISEWPPEAGDRGDPLSQAEKRSTAWSEAGYKRLYVSTPGIQGMCRISDRYEESDQRQWFVPCPHCAARITLIWSQIRDRDGTVVYECQACGEDITSAQRGDMIRAGRWVPTFPDEQHPPTTVLSADDVEAWCERDCGRRDRGYFIMQLYSLLVSWEDTYKASLDADGDPQREKAFVQQVLGVAWEEETDAPGWEQLMLRREDRPLGRIPPGGLVLTGMVDVQGDRLEWGVYAWGVGMSAWLVDKGVIMGDTGQAEVWSRLDEVIYRRWPDAAGNEWAADAFGIDAGFQSHMVYQYVRERRRERVYALDGRAGHTHPLIGAPKRQSVNFRGKRIGSVQLWPTGTWPAKSWVYAALRKTVEGPDAEGVWKPGAWHFPQDCGEDFFQQLTAEYLKQVTRGGRPSLEWHQVRNQANEQLDIAVGCLVLAHHLGLDRYRQADWQDVAETRGMPIAPPVAGEEDAETSSPPPSPTSARGASTGAAAKLRARTGRRRRRRFRSSFMGD